MKLSKIIKIFAVILLGIGLFVAYSNSAVYRAGQKGVYQLVDCPEAETAVILGARVFSSGALSQVLADRMDTGIELYQSGRVKKLLLTGDHGQTGYDEVNAMRKYAIEKGVPEEDIFMDHAGFSTYDSMYRARDIFVVSNAIIVTQEFHLPRALYIARSLGIEARGVHADKREYIGMNYLYLREILARTKAAGQVLIGMKPKYLGPEIPITGDGRATKDTET